MHTRSPYHVGMQLSSVLCRWGLLVALALGVVVMHHTPSEHDQPNMAGAPVVSMSHSQPCEAAMPEARSDGHASHGSGPVLPDHALHLCLAILIFVGGAVLSLWALPRGRVSSPPRMPAKGTTDRVRPPTPVPRRLAVLCVMRC